MSNSSLVTVSRISPNKTSPRNHKIDTITIHVYVGQVTASDMLAWFAQSSAKCSCNYAIGKDGSVGLCVEESDRSWCSSSSLNDNRAITIECASDKTYPYKINDTVYKKLIELVTDICKRNGIKKLLWKNDSSLIGNAEKQNMTVHRWFANKECPAQYVMEHMSDIANKVNLNLGAEADNIASNDETTEEPQWYRVRKSWKDVSSQIGAFESYENARANCPIGYTVYDYIGNAVFTAEMVSEKLQNGETGTQASSVNSLSTEAQKASKILEICTHIAKQRNLFPSVAAAQTILESGYCGTDLALEANNVCGMKCSLSGNTWEGSTWDGVHKYTKKTAEQDSKGNVYYVTADFRSYDCMEDSIADRCQYLLGAMNGSELRYKGIQSCDNYKEQIQLIKNGGYATDTKYVAKITDIIERFHLDIYDTTLTAQPEVKEPYIVQAGKFMIKENAEKLVDKLKNAGFDALIKEE